jgi:hypothetical protein
VNRAELRSDSARRRRLERMRAEAAVVRSQLQRLRVAAAVASALWEPPAGRLPRVRGGA